MEIFYIAFAGEINYQIQHGKSWQEKSLNFCQYLSTDPGAPALGEEIGLTIHYVDFTPNQQASTVRRLIEMEIDTETYTNRWTLKQGFDLEIIEYNENSLRPQIKEWDEE